MLNFRIYIFSFILYSSLPLNISYAQSEVMSLGGKELSSANGVVSQCEILNDIIQSNSGRGDVPAAETFFYNCKEQTLMESF